MTPSAQPRNVRSGSRTQAYPFCVAAVIAVVLLALPAFASADRAFTPRFSANDTGDITIAANTLMTCPTAATNCTNARAGEAQNNNSFNMGYVDVDGVSSTFDSSTSKLRLPTGATVLFAGLYWGADTSAGTNGIAAPDASARGTVLLKVPGAGTYASLGPTATVLDQGTGSSSSRYQGFLDVTSQVKSAGAGTYTLANVQAGTGVDRYAGWSLVVAYRDTTMAPRNLTVFDGFKTTNAQEGPTSFSLTGFKTPPTEPVKTTLGFVSYEGDAGFTPDSAGLNGTKLKDALNPEENFFNSTIDDRGVNPGEREPNYANQLGFDADLVDASGYLKKETSSATIELTTSGDTYFPGVVTFATELYAPEIKSTNEVTDVTHPGGPVQRGDILTYTVKYTNSSRDGADQFIARNNIPTGTTFVPGSLKVANGPGAGAATDAAGDDRAEYESENQRVTFRLGTGATGAAGGRLAVGESTSFSFQVKVDADDLDKATISSLATARYFGQSLGTSLSNTSPVATATVAAPDLTLTNVHEGAFTSGVTSIVKLVVKNSGSLVTDGSTVTVTDPFPAGAFDSIALKSSTGWTCKVTGVELKCTRADALASGATYPAIEVEAKVHDPAPASISNTAGVAGGGDSDSSNNSATDVGTGTGRADLQLTGSTPTSTVASGRTAVYEFVVRNGGPSIARGIVFEDPLGSDYQDAKATTSAGACTTAVRCTIPELAVGGEVKIKVEATVVANKKELTNTASVNAAEPADPTPGNNSASVKTTVPNTADLAVTTSAAPEHPQPGVAGGLTYTVTVRNGGPGTSETVKVIDTLPEKFSLTSFNAPGFQCTESGKVLNCAKTALTVAEGTQTITITGTVAANAASESLTNSVRAESVTRDPNIENNSASTVTVSAAAVDLEMLVEGPPERIAIGSPGTFKLIVKNNGPGESSATMVTDKLPTGLEFVSAGPNCTYATGTRELKCAVGALGVGKSLTSELTVKPAPGTDGQTIQNTASVAAPPSDPVPTNNSSSDSLLVVASANLSLTATLSPTNPGVGQTATLTLTARNAGPNTATGVTVVDQLPQGLEVVGPLPSGCTLSGQTITCTITGLASGGQQSIPLQLVPNDSISGQTVTNTAKISGTSADPNEADNTATTQVPVRPRGDLSLTATLSPSNPTVGQKATLTLAVHNAGPDAATAVTIVDQLPAGLEAVEPLPSGCTRSGQTITCALGGLAGGGDRSVAIQLIPKGSVAGQTVTNTAKVGSTSFDPSEADNTATTEITVPARADLSLTAAFSPSNPAAGQTTTLTLTARNAGPDTASGVTVVDQLPSGLEVVGPLPSGCTLSGQTITCTLGGLASGGERSVAIQLKASQSLNGQTVGNTATVTGTSKDPNEADNTATTPIKVGSRADLSLTATLTPPNPAVGQTAKLNLAVHNSGPDAATGVTIVDQVPSGFEVVGPLPSGCTLSGQTITCTVASLAGGADQAIAIQLKPNQASKGQVLENTAQVGATSFDPNEADNTVKTQIQVPGRADLSVRAALSPANPSAGQKTTLTLTARNSGPEAATAPALTTPLPAGVEVLAPLPTGCALTGQTVTCSIARLESGREESFTIQLIPSQALNGQTVVATTTIRGASEDPNEADNTAFAAITVLPAAGGEGTGPGAGGPGIPAPAPAPGAAGGSGKSESGAGTGAKPRTKGRLSIKMVPSKRSVRVRGTFRYKITVRTLGSIRIDQVLVCTHVPRKVTLIGARRAKITNHRRKVCWKIRSLGPNKRKRLIMKVKVKPGSRHRVVARARVRAANAPKRTVHAKRVRLTVVRSAPR